MSSSVTPPPQRPKQPVGATALEAEPRRRRWPLLLLLGLLLLAGVLFAIWRLTGDSNVTGTGSVASTSTAPASTASTASTATASSSIPNQPTTNAAATVSGPAAAGTVSSNGTVLLGTAASATTTEPTALAPFVGQPAGGAPAPVQSVPADEGFWVGTSPTNRMWVQLTGVGESQDTVKAGARVDFTGTVVDNPAGFAQQVGVDAGEGADQLTAQGAHIAVAKGALKLLP